MNLLSLLGGTLLSKAGETAQRAAAKAAYRVYRKANNGRTIAGAKNTIPEWIDLTQREQEKWVGAAGEILEEEAR